jgi:hypothetical protein
METQGITLDRAKARELYRAYKKHAHYSEPMDDEIRRAYQLLAQGRLIIRALDSVARAGIGDDGWPKLAIARADLPRCQCAIRHDGSATMSCEPGRMSRRQNAASSKWFDFPAGTFAASPQRASWRTAEALVPPVPLHVRPKRGLANYHILWEAEWQRIPPRDPFLLRRIGLGDMWLVVAMWDLTEIERTALAARIGNA